MTIVRLLADDLTGALDTAAEFVPVTGVLPVVWPAGRGEPPVGSAAIDSGTRECEPILAMRHAGMLAELLRGADIAFKKIDSLLRGPTIAEIAACLQAGIWRHCALAPAFPFQGRVTRLGQQYARDGEGWRAVGANLVTGLQAYGVPASMGKIGAALQPGVSVFDAETDQDLRDIVATVRCCGEPVLWAGCGGLAQAISAGTGPTSPASIPRPILGVFGSDQAATAAQLAACGAHWLEIMDDDFDVVPGRLGETGLALVSFRLPPGTARAAAAERIAAAIGSLVHRIDRPGSVVIAGGETLRSLCDAVGATSLRVGGRLVPGVPCSILSGGRWDGVTVISKSGAFGHPLLLRDLILERTDA